MFKYVLCLLRKSYVTWEINFIRIHLKGSNSKVIFNILSIFQSVIKVHLLIKRCITHLRITLNICQTMWKSRFNPLYQKQLLFSILEEFLWVFNRYPVIINNPCVFTLSLGLSPKQKETYKLSVNFYRIFNVLIAF